MLARGQENRPRGRLAARFPTTANPEPDRPALVTIVRAHPGLQGDRRCAPTPLFAGEWGLPLCRADWPAPRTRPVRDGVDDRIRAQTAGVPRAGPIGANDRLGFGASPGSGWRFTPAFAVSHRPGRAGCRAGARAPFHIPDSIGRRHHPGLLSRPDGGADAQSAEVAPGGPELVRPSRAKQKPCRNLLAASQFLEVAG